MATRIREGRRCGEERGRVSHGSRRWFRRAPRRPARTIGETLLVAAALCAASPAFADCASDFDLGKRTHAPFDKALAERVPNTVILGRITQDLAKLAAELRPLARLAPVVNSSVHDRQPEELLRILVVSRDTPAIAAALTTVGAEKQAGALHETMAKFGKRYPSMAERSRRFGPYGEPTEFAKSVLALAPAFGTRAEFVDALAAYACARPGIVAWLEAERAGTDERDNLAWLTYELLTSRTATSRLDELPEPFRTLYLVRYADFEVGDGGVHQLFSNSSGDLVPHMPAALRRIGLETHAEIIERGLALFPSPYPMGDERNRLVFGTIDPRTGKPKKPEEPDETWGAFDDELAKLSEQGWSDDAIMPAALAFARREGVLPR